MNFFFPAGVWRGTGLLVVASMLSACGPGADPVASAPPAAESAPHTAAERPMDEVPGQETNAEGERLYRFANGCVVVVQARQAVVVREGPECESHHRDIALLYASGD